MPRLSRFIDTMIQIIVIATLALIPAAFLPLTQDMFIPIKWAVLVASALLIVVLWAIRLVQTGQSDLAVSRASLGFGALSIASLLTLVIVSKSRVDALLDPLGPPTWIAFTILLLFGSYAFSHRAKTVLTWTILLVASALAVTSILTHFQLLQAIAPGLVFLAERSWTPLGTITAIPWAAFVCLPLLITQATEAWRRRDGLLLICVFLVAAVLMTSVSLSMTTPAGDKISLPFAEAWRITAQSFTVPLRALFGIGIENYMSAFTQGRSAALNTSPMWNIRFAESRSLILHVATTMGIAGVAGLLILARSFLTRTKNVLSVISVGAPILVLLLAPPSLSLLALLVGVYLVTKEQDKIIPIRIPSHLSWLRVATVLLAIGIAGTGIYAGGRAFASELVFMRSLRAREANDGQATYSLQIQALNVNPWNTRYHVAFSQTNFDIANVIARSAREQNADVNQQDRQAITTLIQQAIREAKTAVTISPNNILAWENLAYLYQNLTRVAQGADQWAVASYQQVITLDPTNPLLRLSYATLLSDLGDKDNAFIQFQTTASLKPDYALAHYSLARIYRERQQYLPEAGALAETLKLLPGGSQDEAQVQSELAAAKARLTDEERAQIEQLTGGQQATSSSQLLSPLPETPPELEPKLELPTESSPGALP